MNRMNKLLKFSSKSPSSSSTSQQTTTEAEELPNLDRQQSEACSEILSSTVRQYSTNITKSNEKRQLQHDSSSSSSSIDEMVDADDVIVNVKNMSGKMLRTESSSAMEVAADSAPATAAHTTAATTNTTSSSNTNSNKGNSDDNNTCIIS